MPLTTEEINQIATRTAAEVIERRGDICKCVDWFLVATTAAEALEHNATVSKMAKGLHENLKEIISGEQLEDLEDKHVLLQGYITEGLAEMALAGSLGSIRDKCNVDIAEVKKLADSGFEAIKKRDPIMAAQSFSQFKGKLLKLAGNICGQKESNPGEFNPGEIVIYKDERVRVEEHIGDRVQIFIPSRQEEVWVKADSLEKLEPEKESNPGKEPWQMTLEQYALEKGARPAWVKAGYGETYRTHKRAVERAISEGKAVPPEVLADYPDLQTRGGNPDNGRCYEEAWRFLIKEEEGELIHGSVQTIGRRINHAWVELPTGFVWEPESGEFIKKSYFYERAEPQVQAKYTAEEAAIMAARVGKHGPWTDEERARWLHKED